METYWFFLCSWNTYYCNCLSICVSDLYITIYWYYISLVAGGKSLWLVSPGLNSWRCSWVSMPVGGGIIEPGIYTSSSSNPVSTTQPVASSSYSSLRTQQDQKVQQKSTTSSRAPSAKKQKAAARRIGQLKRRILAAGDTTVDPDCVDMDPDQAPIHSVVSPRYSVSHLREHYLPKRCVVNVFCFQVSDYLNSSVLDF